MKSKTIKILALLLTACVFLGVTSCSGTGDEETTTEATTIASATPLMTDKAEVLAYFNELMASVNSGKAKLTYSSNYNPNSFDCENATFKAALPTIVKLMSDGFNADLGGEVAYGDPLSAVLPVKANDSALVLTEADIADIAINAEAFSRFAEEESKSAEDESYTAEEINLDEDVRKITITLNEAIDPAAGEGVFGAIFNIPDRAAIKAEMDKASEYMTYDGTYEAKYTGCTIYMEIDRTTDKVIKVDFNRNIEVTVDVTGVGTLASMGTTTLKFIVNGTDNYSFDWTDPEATTVAAE